MTDNNIPPKFPSIKHLPFSQEDARQNKFMTDRELAESLLTDRPIVVTEKMDGGNSCITREHVFARTHGREARYPWYSMLKQKHAQIKHRIPTNVAIYGEWMYVVHSIKYDSLPSYFLIFGVLDMDTNDWLPWNMTESIAETLGFATVPFIDKIEQWDGSPLGKPAGTSVYGDTREGYVVRVAGCFPFDKTKEGFAKCVRHGHVSTDEHWKEQEKERNILKQ